MIMLLISLCGVIGHQGQSDGKTADALQALFDTASPFKPVILLLRNLE